MAVYNLGCLVVDNKSGTSGAFDVLIIGVAAMDWLAHVERLPGPDELVIAQEVSYLPGGAGANVAVNLKRLQLRVAFCGKFGADANARLLMEDFSRAGVDTSACIVASDCSQASCFITVDRKGERTIVALGGVGPLQKSSEIPLAFLQKARIVYLTDTYSHIAREIILAARSSGALCIFNPGGIGLQDGLSQLAPLFAITELLLISGADARRLFPDLDTPAIMEAFSQFGIRKVVMTLGLEGACVLEGDRLQFIPVYKLGQIEPGGAITDTTGAGDAFAAGVIYGLFKGWALPEAARAGTVAAALKIRSYGARQGFPELAEFQQAIENYRQ